MGNDPRMLAVLDYWNCMAIRGQETLVMHGNNNGKRFSKHLVLDNTIILLIYEYKQLCDAIVYYDLISTNDFPSGHLSQIMGEKSNDLLVPRGIVLWTPDSETGWNLPDKEFFYSMMYSEYACTNEIAADNGYVYLPSPIMKSVVGTLPNPLPTALTNIIDSEIMAKIRQLYHSISIDIISLPLPVLFSYILSKANTREDIISIAYDIRDNHAIRSFRRACADLLYSLYQGNGIPDLLRAEASAKKLGNRLCRTYGHESNTTIDMAISMTGPSIGTAIKPSLFKEKLWEWRNRKLLRGLTFHMKLTKDLIARYSLIESIERIFGQKIYKEDIKSIIDYNS